ncbi:MAG: tyrosine recombinase XerC [Calditrichaceae bacterium]
MDSQIRKFLDFLILEKRYSGNTAQAYAADLTQFENFALDYFRTGQIEWNRIEKKTLRYFLVFLQENDISKRSIARKLAAIKSLFKFLAREEVIKINPAQAIKLPRFEKKLPEYMTEDEVTRLMQQPDSATFEGVRDLTILEFFYGTGMRLTELINLKVTDVYMNENLIRIIGKGNKERVVPIGSVAVKILEKYLTFRTQFALKDVDNLFVLNSGKKMYPMAVQRIVKKYLAFVSNSPQKSPHVLRHSYATHLLNAGANIRVVKDLLGHESLSTTQIYTHMSIEHLKEIYNQAHPGASHKSSKKLRRS